MGNDIVNTLFAFLITASIVLQCIKRRNCAPSVAPDPKYSNKKNTKKTSPPKSSGSSDSKEGEQSKKPFVSVGPSETFEFAAEGVTQKKIPLTNLSKCKVVYRVEGPPTDAYRISPLLGILEPEGAGTLYITHTGASCTGDGKREEDQVDVLVLNSEAPDDTDHKNLQSIVRPLQANGTTLKLKFELKRAE